MVRLKNLELRWGAELTGEISLVEAGMDRFFNLNKKSDFIGSGALRNKLQSGVDIKIVYLEVNVDDADARGNEPVYHNNKIVGVVTSGAYGFRVKKSLAFAYVYSDLAKEGNEFLLGIQGQKRKENKKYKKEKRCHACGIKLRAEVEEAYRCHACKEKHANLQRGYN